MSDFFDDHGIGVSFRSPLTNSTVYMLAPIGKRYQVTLSTKIRIESLIFLCCNSI